MTEIATTLLDQGDTNGAFDAADRGRQIIQNLLATDPANVRWQQNLSVSMERFGDVQQ